MCRQEIVTKQASEKRSSDKDGIRINGDLVHILEGNRTYG